MANNTGTFFNINDNDGIPLVGVSTDGKVMINHLYGNCLIGSTSVTGTAPQPLQVTGGAYVSGNLGIGTTNPTVKLQVQGDGRFTGIITASRLNSTDVSVTGLTTTNNLYVAGVGTFLSSGLKIRNAANNAQYNITGGAIAADRTLNLPVITATDTLATLGSTQTFTGDNTFSGFFVLSATSSNIYAVNLTTGVLSLGGATQTGTMTLGQSTFSQITDIQAGASGVGTTKTINLGTAGLTSSFTQINIGPTAGVGTVVINSGTNLGIGTTNPTVKLDVLGNGRFTGIVTASSFVGGLAGIASTATTALGFSTTASINTTGIITASSFVGSLTGTASTATTALGFSTTANINTSGIITASTLNIGTGGTVFTTTSIGNIGIGTTNPTVKLDVNGNVNISGILTASKVASGIISNSKVSAYILQKSDVGKYISISSGGVTVPSGIFSEGDVISIYNNSASNQTITQGTSVTMYFSGTSTTGNRTLSQRGLTTILCVGNNTFIIGGAGLS